MQHAKLRVGHVHLTLDEVVPLCNTNRCYTWLVRAARNKENELEDDSE